MRVWPTSLLLLLAACARAPSESARMPEAPEPVPPAAAPAPDPGPAPASADPLASGAASTTEIPPLEAQPPPAADPATLLRRALAERRYLEARSLLEAPELAEFPTRPFVEGYVDLEIGQFDWALQHLTEARERWPDLSRFIEPLQRRALLHSSRLLESLPEFERSRDARELLRVASRLLDAGKPDAAALWVQRAAAFTKGSKRIQAELRALRARIALSRNQPFVALTDWRWLALNAPLEPAAAGADTSIETHFPKTPLTPEQRYLRATRFAEAGRVEETERELDLVSRAPNFRLREGEALHLRGWARFRARDFAGAAEWLQAAAAKGSHQAQRDLYYAAQSLSRDGAIHEAITLFEQLSRQTPKGPLTRSARFRVGSEWLILGEWQRVISSHSAFLDAEANNEHTEAARRERAVAWFASREYRRAAVAFRQLRDTEPRSANAGLYQLLAAVAHEHAGEIELARPLLRDLERNSPLSFAGQRARARLQALGDEVTPLAAASSAPFAPLELPPPIAELDGLGLFDLAESVAFDLESRWVPNTMEAPRARCDGYGQIRAARRRFVFGSNQASRVGFWNRPLDNGDWVWRCVYPNPYPDVVLSAAGEWNVSPALIYAVMRQESGFHSSIESPARARGLMQIIPPTAERIAAELSEVLHPGMMDAPSHNIRFGTFYLRKLLDVFQSHPAPAIAAYNAGPGAALRWRHATEALPLEVFIARIPFDETRGYVQRVLGNLAVYQLLYPEYAKVEVPALLESSPDAIAPASMGTLPIDPHWY